MSGTARLAAPRLRLRRQSLQALAEKLAKNGLQERSTRAVGADGDRL